MLNKNKEEEIEVGKDILSYCGKCKADSTHVISAKDGDKISKVMCRTCQALHNYRKPKGVDAKEAKIKPVKSAKPASTRKVPRNASKKWNDLLANYDLNDAQDYIMKKNYNDSSLINHPSFGIGVVTRRIDQKKIEVQFENGTKLLVINRK